MRMVALACHPDTPSDTVRAIEARITRNGGLLTAGYVIVGDIDRLRIPQPRAPRFAEDLWRHTCCEIFVARHGGAAYHEFNFSPSGEWAAYAFTRYRKGEPLTDAALNPRIETRKAAGRLELDAWIACDPGAILLGLSAVIEERDGSLSYWALKHPPGKPDFHHPDAFALELA